MLTRDKNSKMIKDLLAYIPRSNDRLRKALSGALVLVLVPTNISTECESGKCAGELIFISQCEFTGRQIIDVAIMVQNINTLVIGAEE